MDVAIRALDAGSDDPSVSRWAERHATRDQVAELVVLRAPHQLREADSHTFAIPRLTGRAKAALVEIQADEYGGGRPERIHADLFAKTLSGMGLDASYGAYVDHVPALALAASNLMSLFGLHRRLRGACVGHLALYESTSAVANRRYAGAMRRVGWDDDEVLDFFEEHVEADAAHESIALVDMAGGLAASEPELAAQIVWGAAALLHLDGLLGRYALGRWTAGESALRLPLAVPV
jgi:pyrroloquinoline quinone (PQQ) biosynthesis protein C